METVPIDRPPPGRRTAISQLPYLPGLDGMRALAVVAVMVYHANSDWLPGGFLGVEVFFVISGYLITLLLISEHERSDRINLGQFWLRRARRLLPVLFLMMTMLVIYTAIFNDRALGQLRGDVLAGVFYVSNWFQIWIGAGYTAPADFAPLRHLWSLGVEEQFYLVWPLVMVLLLRIKGRRIADASRWLVLAAVLISVGTALLYHEGRINLCDVSPEAYWTVGDRCISKADGLYLNTISRASGLLLGAALAMVWRPNALKRGPVREKGPLVDLIAVVGFIGLGLLSWYLHVTTLQGADPWLFRGGLFLSGIVTLMVIIAVSHPGAVTGKLLANPVLLWIGTRSYGLYLYHWPIYQIIRGAAGNRLTIGEFALAMAITAAITELSYRFFETPIRKGYVGRWWTRMRAQRDPTPRRVIAIGGASCVAVATFAGVNLATAELRPNEVEESLEDAEDFRVTLPTNPPDSPTDPSGDTAVAVPTSDNEGPPSTERGGTRPRQQSESTTTPVIEPPSTPPPPATRPPATETPATEPPATAPPATAPPATAPPATETPTTGAPPPPPAPGGDLVAVGDSVMAGAARELTEEYGFRVYAEESRSFDGGVDVIEALAATGDLGDIVVIHLGANQGDIEQGDLDQMMAPLEEVSTVLWVTNRLDEEYVYRTNSLINELPSRYSNARVLDWASVGNDCSGACFYNDNLHLAGDGREFYADRIAEAAGLV
ncbi:MAG: acyltransferase family protein [Acidimicrobiia bacterium]|nr:acyltransferase family protein [Acidimicrobiia bacterium]